MHSMNCHMEWKDSPPGSKLSEVGTTTKTKKKRGEKARTLFTLNPRLSSRDFEF